MIELNDAMVEAGAKAAYEAGRSWYKDKPTWEEAQNGMRSDVCADHHRIMARAALTAALALLPEAEQGWRPIETAPKDKWIWVYEPFDDPVPTIPNEETAHWRERPLSTSGFYTSAGRLVLPTHWRPLPAPPPAKGSQKA